MDSKSFLQAPISGFPFHMSRTAPSDSDHMVMIADAHDIRARMEAELIALRRAQSVFADAHPSVDIQGKLQDLQELYIGDLLVKDCQISQYKSQIDNLLTDRSHRTTAVSTPTASASSAPQSSAMAARVQSLQKAAIQERQRRVEAEAKIEEINRANEATTRASTAHRIEVHQLKTRLSSLQESNKKLLEKIATLEASPSEHVVTSGTPRGGMSPASSAAGGMSSTERVPYAKYAALRSEKRQVESRLNKAIEDLKLEKQVLLSERNSELERTKEHNRIPSF